jgi:hypothetical protein
MFDVHPPQASAAVVCSCRGAEASGSGDTWAESAPRTRDRRGLRIALLSAAAAILLLGATAASVYGYVTIAR